MIVHGLTCVSHNDFLSRRPTHRHCDKTDTKDYRASSVIFADAVSKQFKLLTYYILCIHGNEQEVYIGLSAVREIIMFLFIFIRGILTGGSKL